jgi:predicted RNase H-like HicB family nuclease
MEDRMSDTVTAPGGEQTLTYTAAFRFEDGWWWAQVVEVPEAFGQGRTLDEARASVSQAADAALALRVEEGESVPPSGQVTVGPVTVARP